MLAIVTFLLLAAGAIAVPHRVQKRSFKAPVRGRPQQGPLDDVVRVHQKYGSIHTTTWTTFPLPAAQSSAGVPASYQPVPNITASLVPSATRGQEDGEVTATPEDNEIQYLSPVSVGGQTLNLNFDTGSSDLWVFSSELKPSVIGNHSVFNPALSATFQPYDNASWSIQYGDGSFAGGVVGFDTVHVGRSTVEKQCVELATSISIAFTQDPASDGLLGLGFSSINQVRPISQKTFFENVMNDLSEPLFTADLEDNMGAGTYEFGNIDNSKFKGDIHYVSIDNSKGWWQFVVPSVRIDNRSIPCENTCIPAIADTGTSLLYLNSAVVVAYYDQVQGSQLWQRNTYIYPCGSSLPALSLQIGDHYATIKGEDMTYLAFGNDSEGPLGTCMGGLQLSPSSMQIVGDVFLKQVFAVFDGGNHRFGVAEKN